MAIGSSEGSGEAAGLDHEATRRPLFAARCWFDGLVFVWRIYRGRAGEQKKRDEEAETEAEADEARLEGSDQRPFLLSSASVAQSCVWCLYGLRLEASMVHVLEGQVRRQGASG